MGKATKGNARVIKYVIDTFCERSGLNLNLAKSKVFFSKANGAGLKKSITDILGFSQTLNLGKYLGVLLRHGHVSRAESGRLIDKVVAKYAGWKKKFLSTAGRATLIQSVASAMPIYEMQLTWLPEHICAKLDKLNRDFLWSNDISQRKTHLVGWKQVVEPKKDCGLGIREARLNNEAMLAKLVWKILKSEKSVWLEMVQAKYLKGECILHISPKNGDSPLWKGILKVASKLRSSFRWKIGNGRTIHFCMDIWFGDSELCHQVPQVDPRDFSVTINQVLDEYGNRDMSILRTEVPQALRDLLLKANLFTVDESDRILWNETASGDFSCQSAYHTLRRQSQRA